MHAKKMFAFLAVAVMLIAPMACVFSAEAQGDSSSNGEIKEGVHIHLKDVKGPDFIALFGIDPTTEESSNYDFGSFNYYIMAILIPGLNTQGLFGEDISKHATVKWATADFKFSSIDIDFSHYVSDDYTKVTTKFSVKLDIDHANFTIECNDGKGKDVIISPMTEAEIIKGIEEENDYATALQQYAFKGDYAEKMRNDLKGKTFGDSFDVKASGTVEFYAESTLNLFKGAGDNLYYKSGGYLLPMEIPILNGALPMNKIEAKADLKATTKFGETDVEIKDTIALKIAAELQRDYCGTEETKVGNNTVYRDKFSGTPECYLKHSAYYNGAANGTGFHLDLSNALSMIADGQYFKIDGSEKGMNKDYFVTSGNDKYNLFEKLVRDPSNNDSAVISYKTFILNADTDTEAIQLMKDKGHVEEGKDGYSLSYDDANGTNDSVRKDIEGSGSSNNTMVVIAIVIVVIVILALVALWYFKFRPSS